MKEIKRLIRCDNGHFFDGGKYDECPHCNNTKIPEVTVFLSEKEAQKALHHTDISDVIYDEPVEEVITNEPEEEVFVQDDDYEPVPSFAQEKNHGHTVHYFQKAIGNEPVVGWLVCIEGIHSGEDFKIKSGRNFIGRSGDMNISLSGDRSVSRDKHAILTYDPRRCTFTIQPGESSELTYLNDDAVLVPTKLKLNDRIVIGESELIFVPFCSAEFNWEKQKKEKQF